MLLLYFSCSSNPPLDIDAEDTVQVDETGRSEDSSVPDSVPEAMSTSGTIDHLTALAAMACDEGEQLLLG